MPYQSVFRPDLFKGQTIIITGGGSGIGRCTAHELVALGANVAILGRTAEKLAEVKAEIEEDGGQVLTHVCDIRDEAMVIAAIDAVQMAEIDANERGRTSGEQPPLPSRLVCGQPVPPWPRANGKGWGGKCDVDTITNVYLGVPRRTDTSYRLRFKTDHPVADSLRVYVNGKYYTARLESDGEYVAKLNLDSSKLYSPAVMVTVEWTRSFSPPAMRLLEIEFA